MLEIQKYYVLDVDQRPIAVQIPIEQFEQIEEILEDLGLARMMAEAEQDEVLSGDEALAHYQSLKSSRHVGD